MKPKKNRRKHRRVEHRSSVYFEAQGSQSQGTIVNFSETGMLLQSEDILAAGAQLTIPTKLNSGETCTLSGTVVWNRKPSLSASGVNTPGHMGIKLSAVPPEYLESVQELRKKFDENSNRGSEERYEVYQQVRFKSGNTFLTEYTENLSRGGMYIATDEALEPGDTITACLEIPGFPDSVDIKGRVAYRLEGEDAEERGRVPGVGLQFIDVPQEVKERLNHYIQRLAVHRSTTERHLSGPVPDNGSLNDYLVPELLLVLLEREATGILRLQRKGLVKEIYFRKGQPVYVTSPMRSESLSQFLTRRGILSLSNMNKWLPYADKGDLELGRALLKEKFMERSLLIDALVEYQEERITNSFTWFDGTYEFSEIAKWKSSLPILPLQTVRMIFSGVTHWYDAALVSSWMGLSEGCSLKRKAMPPAGTPLSSVAYKILHELWVPQTISKISEELKIPLEDLLPAAYALVISKWLTIEFPTSEEKPKQEKKEAQPDTPSTPPVEEETETEVEIEIEVAPSPPEESDASPEPSPASLPDVSAKKGSELIEEDFDRLANLDYFELLGVTRDAGTAEITRAYLERTARYSSQDIQLENIKDDELLRKVSQILSWIKTAHDTLMDPNMKEMYLQQKPTSQGRDYFELEEVLLIAMTEIKNKKYDKVISVLEPLMEKDPFNATIAGWYGWALFKSDPSAHRDQAAELLEKSINRDPSDPQLYYFLGEVQVAKQDWAKAELSYLQALRLQANFEDAGERLKRVREQLASSSSDS